MMIRPTTSSKGDRKCLRAYLFQLPRGTAPVQVLQELVTGKIVASWTELQLSPLGLVVFTSMLSGGRT